jgi:hypothetical protein
MGNLADVVAASGASDNERLRAAGLTGMLTAGESGGWDSMKRSLAETACWQNTTVNCASPSD